MQANLIEPTGPGAAGTPAGTLPPALLPSAADELVRIRRVMPVLLKHLSRRMLSNTWAFPLLHFGEKHRVVRLSPETVGAAEDWFFIGDLHGDFFALHSLLRHAETVHPGCKVLFLGDMVDRGDHPFECLFLLLEWGLRRPGRLAWVAGNHDISFELANSGDGFTAQVSPAELLQVLNQVDVLRGFRRELGCFLIELGRRLPRALLFPDGLLATHGGFPLSDLQAHGAQITDEAGYLDWINSPACLKDFTWTRIHRAPKKIPDRHSTGAQYGFKDFEAFCDLQPDWFPVQRMITGHEHPADGCAIHASYKVNPAMTLVGFGFDDLRAMPAAYQYYAETLHMGRGRTGYLPAVLTLAVDRRELEWMYPELLVEPALPVEPSTDAAAEPSPKTVVQEV